MNAYGRQSHVNFGDICEWVRDGSTNCGFVVAPLADVGVQADVTPIEEDVHETDVTSRSAGTCACTAEHDPACHLPVPSLP